ncbi:lysine histidine transporter-like 3 isoform X2 [Selaginella moellendorffii]|nr:lysine histidine transporter-like 3 isoform X2 [Selaginella moellendorffii]|eukprot:XP_024540615.1 lysine histidine transporter-like 3 isoform X2 [Selaginella moellendorffii]
MSLLLVSYVITFCTLWQMVQLHHLEDERIDRFPDLGGKAFGRGGWYFAFALQMILQVSVNTAYLVTGGHAISLIANGGLRDFQAILVFAATQLAVCLIPNFSSLTWVSTLAVLMSIGYTTIIWGSAIHLHDRRSAAISYDIPNKRRVSKTFNAFGQIAFAYGGQNVVLEIQSLMRAPSTKAMWHGVVATYVIVAFCYIPVAVLGYWAFGNLSCYGNVLRLLHSSHLPSWPFYTANLFLVLHLTGAYQVYALPVYEMLQPHFSKMSPFKQFPAFVFARYSYIACTCFVAVLFPFFKNIIALVGGLVIAPSSYFVPCLFWLRIKRPEPLSLSWLANMACIVLGVTITVLGFVGSLWEIIVGMKEGSQTLFHFDHTRSCSI